MFAVLSIHHFTLMKRERITHRLTDKMAGRQADRQIEIKNIRTEKSWIIGTFRHTEKNTTK